MLGKKFLLECDNIDESLAYIEPEVPAEGEAVEGAAAEAVVEAEQVQEEPVDPRRDVIVGIRPEFVRVEQGELCGKIYTALPAGMETTVKLDVNGDVVTSVVFGSVDYPADAEIKFEFVGNGIILFDAKSRNKLGMGKLRLANLAGEASKTVEKAEKPAKATKSTAKKATTKSTAAKTKNTTKE